MRGIRAAAWLVAVAALAAPVQAQDIVPANVPAAVQDAIRDSIKDCAPERATLEPGFIAEKDVNGDQRTDYILDYGKFQCSGSASFYCGTGGCLTQVFASLPDGGYVKALDENVRRLRFGRVHGKPAMLLDLHGSACGKVGAAPCPQTRVWNGRTFVEAK